MKIIHFADLHIDSSAATDELSVIREKLVRSIRDQISNDSLLVLVSGDFVDKAKDYFDCVFGFLCGIELGLQKLAARYLGILCCPGNHDHSDVSFELFNDMYKRINQNHFHEYSPKNTVQFTSIETEDTDFILVNSSYNADNNDAWVNIDDTRRALEKSRASTRIVVLHHPIINSENSNNASLKNAYEFLLLIQEYRVDLVLHSHVHQADCISFGNFKCPLISVGTLLSEGGKNINNQFNLISLRGNGAHMVENYRYHADQLRKGDKGDFTATTLWSKEGISDNEYITGSSFFEIYNSLYKNIGENKSILNISIHYKNQYEMFKNEIIERFAEPLKKAKQWQSERIPDNLAFNHGERLYSDRLYKGKSTPFDYIIKAIKDKDYINRAIIPLFTFPEVHDSRDGNLPSFTLAQFGFADEAKKELILTVYFRAWEISKFAKINICETYLICERIKKAYPSMKHVRICIFAFRSHIHKDFSCFEKAEIDKMDAIYKISHYIATHNVAKIIFYLEEKKKLRESVISLYGLEELRKSIKGTIDAEKEEGISFYPSELLFAIDDLLLKLREIAEIRTTTSDAEAIEHLYLPLDAAYDAVIAPLLKCAKEVE